MFDAAGVKLAKFSEHTTGLDLYLDPNAIDAASTSRIRELLQAAITALDRRQPGP